MYYYIYYGYFDRGRVVMLEITGWVICEIYIYIYKGGQKSPNTF
jgi:hypothetical protein